VWSWLLANDAEVIRCEAERYCPELPFAADAASVLECPADWYEDYRLIRLSWPQREAGAVTDVYAFYAPGDFRPLDTTGRAIGHLNKVGPLKLTPTTTPAYVALRLTLELSALDLMATLVRDGGLSVDAAQALVREFGISAAGATLKEYLALSAEVRATWDAAHWESAVRVHAPAATPLAPEVVERPPMIVADLNDLPPAVQAAVQRLSEAALRPGQTTFPLGEVTRAGGLEAGLTSRHELWLLRRPESGTVEIQRVTVDVDDRGQLVVTYSSSAPLPLDAAAGFPAVRIASPRRAATVMIDAQWRRLADDERASLRRELRHFDVNAEQALFRDTRLPFYQHYRLLEILVPQRRDYRRTYALIATGEDLEPLNGTSPVLHRINAKVGELTVNDTTVDAYLRFFCWAVHGDAGPFNIARSFRELPLEALPGPDLQRTLRGLEFGVRPVADDEAARFEYPPPAATTRRRKAHLTYSGAIFEAWFLVQTTGMVEMQHDEPRAADLAIRREGYGKDDLFVLQAWVQTKGPRPAVRHYLQHLEAKSAAAPLASDRVVDAQEFLRGLATGGSTADVVVDGAIELSSTSFTT